MAVERTAEQNEALKSAQQRAWLRSAAAEALAAKSLDGFMDAMNRVVSCNHGNLPRDVEAAWDRVLMRVPKDWLLIQNWLEEILANGKTLIAQQLDEDAKKDYAQ